MKNGLNTISDVIYPDSIIEINDAGETVLFFEDFVSSDEKEIKVCKKEQGGWSNPQTIFTTKKWDGSFYYSSVVGPNGDIRFPWTWRSKSGGQKIEGEVQKLNGSNELIFFQGKNDKTHPFTPDLPKIIEKIYHSLGEVSKPIFLQSIEYSDQYLFVWDYIHNLRYTSIWAKSFSIKTGEWSDALQVSPIGLSCHIDDLSLNQKGEAILSIFTERPQIGKSALQVIEMTCEN